MNARLSPVRGEHALMRSMISIAHVHRDTRAKTVPTTLTNVVFVIMMTMIPAMVYVLMLPRVRTQQDHFLANALLFGEATCVEMQLNVQRALACHQKPEDA